MDEPGSATIDRSGRLALVLTTVPDATTAERIVATLVEERLIACANIGAPVLSIYRWEGQVAREEEVMVLMKVPAADVERLFARLSELHPYSVPELVQIPVEGVSQAYCRWVIESTRVSA